MIGDTYYTSMIINSARKAMLDNITALDKETFQRELESHLKLEFKYKDELDQLTNNWNELKQHIKEYLEEWQNSDDEWVKGKCDMARDILYDMEEIKEGNNE